MLFYERNDPTALLAKELHVSVNRAYLNLFGYANEMELRGKHIKELIPSLPDKLKKKTYKAKGFKKEGLALPLHLRALPVSPGTEKYTLVTIFRDTPYSDEVARRNRRYRAMISQSHKLLVKEETNEQEYLKQLTSFISEKGGYHLCFIALGKEKKSGLQLICSLKEKEKIAEQLLHSAMKSIETKSTILCEDVESALIEEKAMNCLIEEKINSYISLPLISELETTGSMNIFSRNNESFGEERDSLEALAENIAFAIHSIRLKKVQSNLEEQLLQAQKMETIGTLAGGIAHDLNNILTPILGYSELVLSYMKPDDPLFRYNEQILNCTSRAREMVKKILTFSHREVYSKKTVSIDLIVEEAMELMHSLIPKTIEIDKRISRECGPMLADPGQIHQVIANLCTNSFQAMNEQNGKLIVELSRISVSDEMKKEMPQLHKGEFAELKIKDNGAGMDEQTMERIYEPFFTTKPVGEGTGLGMSVVHGIVSNHGGHIQIKSEKGKGTEVTIYLPLLKENELDFDDLIALDKIRKGMILLIENNKEITELIKLILTTSGYKVEHYNRGDLALQAFNTNPESYSLIICDLMLEGLSGLDFIIKANHRRKEIPAIIVTAHDDKLTERKKKEYNIKKVLYKPIMRNSLLDAVSRYILEEAK